MSSKTVMAIIISLLASVFESKAQSPKSSSNEKFSVVEAKMKDGKPIIGSINTALKNYAKKIQYPWCLKINMALDLKGVTKNGLPIKSESDIANKFEDELLKEINKLAATQYIGHFYNDTFLDIYVYLDNPEKVNQYLKNKVNEKSLVRPFAFEIKKDPEWGTVNSFLK